MKTIQINPVIIGEHLMNSPQAGAHSQIQYQFSF